MADTFNIFITSEAESDLDEIFEYRSFYDSHEKAVYIYNRIKNRVLSLKENPRRGRVIPELKYFEIVDYREIIFRPYRIIFYIRQRDVYVFGIFDGRRDLKEIIMDRLLM